jgi:TonB family protein
MLKYTFYFLVFSLVITACEDTITECPCTSSAQLPVYRDGVEEMYRQLYHVIAYPAEAREDSVQGIVKVLFDVFPDGSLGNYEVVNDTLGHGLPEAALLAVQSLNDRGFCPAMQDCKPDTFRFTLPIKFVLQF